jgi:hypothetical protein
MNLPGGPPLSPRLTGSTIPFCARKPLCTDVITAAEGGGRLPASGLPGIGIKGEGAVDGGEGAHSWGRAHGLRLRRSTPSGAPGHAFSIACFSRIMRPCRHVTAVCSGLQSRAAFNQREGSHHVARLQGFIPFKRHPWSTCLLLSPRSLGEPCVGQPSISLLNAGRSTLERLMLPGLRLMCATGARPHPCAILNKPFYVHMAPQAAAQAGGRQREAR